MFSLSLRTAGKKSYPIFSQIVSTVDKIAKTEGTETIYRPSPSPEATNKFGDHWKQPEFVFDQPNGNVLGQAGMLIMDWWNGAPPKPPVINCNIIDWADERKIDTSGCRLAFLNAMRKIVQEHVEKRREAEEKAKGEAVKDDGTIPEPEGVTLKHSVDGAKQAQADLAACLRKGKSTPESLRDILGDEAKSTVTDLLKKRFLSEEPLKTFHKNTGTRDKEYNEAYADLQKAEVVKLEKIQIEFKKYEAAANVVFRDFKAEQGSLEKLFDGLTKDYKDLIKDSDGLTSMRPAVVKALEKARDTGAELHLTTALGEFKKQKDDVKKAGTKEAATFLKEMEKFEKKWLA